MEYVHEEKLYFDSSRGFPCLKQLTILWCFMAVLVIAMDMLSFIGLLPFPGGYTFPVIAFVYFTLAPGMWSMVSSLGTCLTPAVLFLLLNVMIIAILLSSGCLASLSKEDMSTLLPVAASPVAAPVEEKATISKSRTLTRSSSSGASGRPKVARKVKRQYSAPNPIRHRPELLPEVGPEQEARPKDEQGWHASGLIIMELPSSEAGDHHHAKSQSMGFYSNNLMTCDQDVFNEIIGNYIDKFKQDILQQEMKGGHLLSSSYTTKW